MSNVYSIEPPTRGKVVVTTTLGDIDIELWPKEAPLAVRNFCQLCMENYFDGVIFHRIIPKFMAQTGDPTGTGMGGDSVYGENFKDELHSRLKFSHRGIVAMASSGRDTNGSQFFFTLGECKWLDGKHTIFGKVTGDSIYNMDALGEVETGENDRPLYPPKIISTEVVACPFDDIVPREKIVEVVKAPPKKKMNKQVNLLSFGDEAEVEDQAVAAIPKMKIRSSHDVLNDPTLSAEPSIAEPTESALEATKRKLRKEKPKDAAAAAAASSSKHEDDNNNNNSSGQHDNASKLKDMEEIVEKKLEKARASSIAAEKTAEREARIREMQDLKKEILKLNASLGGRSQRSGLGEDSIQPLLTPIEQKRQHYMSKKQLVRGRESMTLAKLAEFTKKLKGPAAANEAEPEKPKEKRKEELIEAVRKEYEDESRKDDGGNNDDSEETKRKRELGQLTATLEDYDDSGWQNANIKFEKEKKIPNPYERNHDNDYSVFDPRKHNAKKSKVDSTGETWEKGRPLL